MGVRELSRNTSRVLRELERTGEPVIVTREGRPIGALVPVDQDQLEDLVLATAPEFTWHAQSADDDDQPRPLREVARERGFELPAEAEQSAESAAQMTEWARAAVAREFEPLSFVLTSAILDGMTVQAAGELTDITSHAIRVVEHDTEGDVPARDDLQRITELNASLYAYLLRRHLSGAFSVVPERVESTIAETAREVAGEVRLINDAIITSPDSSVTIYEAALRAVDAANRQIGEAETRLFHLPEGR